MVVKRVDREKLMVSADDPAQMNVIYKHWDYTSKREVGEKEG